MQYELVEWPEIQQYMERPDYQEKVLFDPVKNLWAIPQEWTLPESYEEENDWGEIGDLEDALG